MAHSFTLVPAAYVYLVRNGSSTLEVLLQLRQNTGFMDGYWACGIAGHVEQGESVVGTAMREATEELGIHLTPEALTPLTSMHRTDGTDAPIEQRVDWFFTCSSWQGEPSIAEPRKAAAIQWFALDELPAKVPPHERRVLDGLAAKNLPAIVTYGWDAGDDGA